MGCVVRKRLVLPGDFVGFDTIARASDQAGARHRVAATLSGNRGANIQSAAVHNRKVILRAIRALKAAEHGALAEITGLTQPAVFRIVKELVREGLVISPKTRQGAKGQPAAVLAINPDYAFSIGVSVEQDSLALAIVDFAGTVRGRRHLGGVRPGRPELRRFFADCIDDFLDDHSFDASKIVGVGVTAWNGPVLLRSRVGTRPLEGHLDAVGSELAALVGSPLYVEDQAVAAAHAEATLGQVSAPDPVFYLHVSDQLSGVLIIDQQVVRGDPLHRNAPAALPQLNPFRSSQTNLAKMLGETVSVPAFLQFSADRGLPMHPLDEIDLADAGVDAVVEEWVNGAADLLYLPLLSIFCCLSLSSVRVGGSLPHGITARLCQALSARLSLNLGLNWPGMAVRPASLDTMGSAVGAGLMAFGDKWDAAR